MGISAVASYIGGALIDVVDLDASVVARCFPTAAAWPGRTTLADLADRQIRRRAAALAIPEPAAGREPRLPDPGFARFRADGEAHLFSPKIAGEITLLSVGGVAGGPGVAGANGTVAPTVDEALARYRAALARPAGERAVPRDELRIRAASVATPLAEVEDARSIVRRFVVSAMSVGALSPEAHQALTIGIQRAGGAANTGEGGEDPAWYVPGPDGRRHDARIKQVASARFGVTAAYLSRADQLEIKIAQGSKPGEGGQLPGRKATAYIAALRRGQPGQSYISPPPHHDIYSIEDLAQLIADLRAINPLARIGVKLVASRGVGTIAAGVAKAGASYIHLSGHAGGTGASPLSSIKHVGAPWELGLAEVHQVLLRNDLRDRVVLRTDGGLQTGRDLIVAALLGAEEFAFGTAALVAIGCDMARQCHLDTCPTGIATQREDLRAKFAGTPDDVVRFFTAIAEDFRRELAAVGARSVGEIVGESRRLLHATPAARAELAPVIGARPWPATAARRANPTGAGGEIGHAPASALEVGIAAAFRGQGSVTATGLRLTTADRSFGAGLTGALERGELHGPIRLELRGAAGQSFGAFAGAGRRAPPRRPGQRLRREGPVGRLGDGRPRARPRGRGVIGGDRRQHRALWRDRRPAPPRRPGGDALRGPQQRCGGRGRGDRPARLRIHDRRHRRRPRTGRRQLRGRDDRRPGVSLRPDRAPHRRPRRSKRRWPSASPPPSPTAPTARAGSSSSSVSSRRTARPVPSWPAACSTRPISRPASGWSSRCRSRPRRTSPQRNPTATLSSPYRRRCPSRSVLPSIDTWGSVTSG